VVLGSGYNGVWDLNSQSFLPDSGQRIWMDTVYWTQLDRMSSGSSHDSHVHTHFLRLCNLQLAWTTNRTGLP